MIDDPQVTSPSVGSRQQLLATEEDTVGPDARPLGDELPRGASLGRYMILRRVGAGAMGVVYAAFDPELDRKVAIKVLRPSRPGADSRGSARLLREAQAMAKLSHPNVVVVHDAGTLGEQVYIAMEFVRGRTVSQWIAQDRPPWRVIARAFGAAGRGLAAAHDAHLVHRDFKPDNVLIDDGGRARVTDFGLARRLPETADRGSADSITIGRAAELELTASRDGGLVGTPAYMAPEHFAGQTIDARTDQFSFCVSLWEALYGERPYRGATVAALAGALIRGERAAVPSPSPVPSWVRRCIERGLETDPERRWPSMHALLHELQRDPTRRTRRMFVVAGFAGLGVLGAVGWWRSGQTPCRGAPAQIAQVWGPQQADALDDALARTHARYAPTLGTGARATLDAYAQRWVAMHTDACEATRIRQEQSEAILDLRMACLHRAKVRLEVVVDTVANVTADSVAKVPDVVELLPPLRDCADIDTLRATERPPEPQDAARVAELERLLAEVSARLIAGDPDGATELWARIEPRLEGLDYPAVVVSATIDHARLLVALGDLDGAEPILRSALQQAAAAQRWNDLHIAARSLLHLVAIERGRHEEGQLLEPLVRARATDDADDADVAHEVLGLVLKARGDLEAAEIEFRAALAFREREDPPRPHAIATARYNVAEVLFARGEFAASAAEHRQVLTLREETLGPGHPDVAHSHNSIGVVLVDLGELEAAEAHLTQAEEIFAQALGPDHVSVALARNARAVAVQKAGRYAEAEPILRSALAGFQTHLGPKHPWTIGARSNLAVLLRRLGQPDAAVAQLQAVVPALIEVHGPEHPDIGVVRNNLSQALRSAGRFAEAEAESRAAIALLEDTLGAEHPSLATLRGNLGYALAGQEKHADALAEFSRALQIRTDALEPEHVDVLTSRYDVGHMLVELERGAEARESLEPLLALGDAFPPALAGELRLALARALWASGERSRARDLARDAVVRFTAAGDTRTDERRRARAWLDAHPG